MCRFQGTQRCVTRTSRGFIVVAFCSAILHHWMCKIPTEVATLTDLLIPR
ncbi:hypothetical protein [Piscirickettsia salmonis]|nr:hypothetical protein [Piscirickettsia salmonis]